MYKGILKYLDRKQFNEIARKFGVSKSTMYRVIARPEKNMQLFETLVTTAEQNRQLRERARELDKAEAA